MRYQAGLPQNLEVAPTLRWNGRERVTRALRRSAEDIAAKVMYFLYDLILRKLFRTPIEFNEFYSPRDFEYPEQANTTQDREAERRENFLLREDQLQDTADHDETVEAIEQWHEVALEKKIHFHGILVFLEIRG